MKAVFERASATIRQKPGNYLLALCYQGRWICDPDLGANLDMMNIAFEVTTKFKGRYASGEDFIKQFERIQYHGHV
jgi:hypothetical protein